jgi:hypothetical protein
VNEAAFRVFVASIRGDKPVSGVDAASVEAAWADGVTHVKTMRQFTRDPLDPAPRTGELGEAVVLAQRLAAFFLAQSADPLVVEPEFNGCGWLDQSTGDVLAGGTLFEVKAGERHFRGIDINQLLTYCALNFATKAVVVSRVGLVNPRVGTFAIFDLDDLCNQCAGTCAADVLDEILQYVSESMGAYDH